MMPGGLEQAIRDQFRSSYLAKYVANEFRQMYVHAPDFGALKPGYTAAMIDRLTDWLEDHLAALMTEEWYEHLAATHGRRCHHEKMEDCVQEQMYIEGREMADQFRLMQESRCWC